MVYNQPVAELYAQFRLSKYPEVSQILDDKASFSNCCYCLAKAWKIHKDQDLNLDEALQISINQFLNQELNF